ncbi:DUF4236 domain-containing protein [Photobacterium leiognathi]|uniref:DUF4236 domain-containing protein n=1 Tax=Photobacterium leiognathi TaxID=553611 RepID=UPI001EDCE323|nr:DUF4236 domain-containing protein [Photobacterium leiognathi]MCG3884463.1 DUF4236 domain-containing protein [Photobacterium leiognathi]
MVFRFRKSISIAPGVKLNIGKKGISSLSVGKRGMGISIGRNGTYGNISLPGTGLSYRTRLGGGSSKIEGSQSSDYDIAELTEMVESHNAINDVINNIHTLSPNILETKNTYDQLYNNYRDMVINGFNIPEPARPEKPTPIELPLKPTEMNIGKVKRFFSSRSAIDKEIDKLTELWKSEVELINESNAFEQAQYVEKRTKWAQEHMDWTLSKRAFERESEEIGEQLPTKFSQDNDYFDGILIQAFSETQWPHETNIGASVDIQNKVVNIDIDLPEIEDIPFQLASIKKSELVLKDKSQKALIMDYARYIHGIVFRTICIAFNTIPVNKVKLSAYTQRLISSTGHISDDYILTCEALRSEFEEFNYQSLDSVDPISALEMCQLGRKMTSTGIFKSVPALNA